MVLLVLPACSPWPVAAEGGRGGKTLRSQVEGGERGRVIIRQRYLAQNRQRKLAERSRGVGEGQGKSREQMLALENEKKISGERSGISLRKRQRIRHLPETKKPTKLEIENASSVSSTSVIHSVKIQRSGIRKRKQRRKKMSPRIQTLIGTHVGRNYDVVNEHKARSDLLNMDLATASIPSEEVTVNILHGKNAENSFNPSNVTLLNGEGVSHSDVAQIVQDFDQKSILVILANKEQRVGDVVLVNGRPAVIKKRKKSNEENDKSEDNSEKKRKIFARNLLKRQNIVRVKVKAGQGITQARSNGRKKIGTKISRRRGVKRRKLNINVLNTNKPKDKERKQIVLNSFEELNTLTNKPTLKSSTQMKVQNPNPTVVSPRSHQTVTQSTGNLPLQTLSNPSVQNTRLPANPPLFPSTKNIFRLHHPHTFSQSNTNGANLPTKHTIQIPPSTLPQHPTHLQLSPTLQFPQFLPQESSSQPFLKHQARNVNLQTGAFTLHTIG